jgi:hypothetical protein
MRDYDPTTGRYLQADPLGLVDGASIFGYVRQNPGRLTDPTGQCPWCIVALSSFAIDVGMQLLLNGGNFGCIDWGQAALSGLLGAGQGALFRILSKVHGRNPLRPTYGLYRTWTKQYGFRVESHPISRRWPNSASWPHWHVERWKDWHLPLLEPINALSSYLRTDNCCSG